VRFCGNCDSHFLVSEIKFPGTRQIFRSEVCGSEDSGGQPTISLQLVSLNKIKVCDLQAKR
jgi:hypothetical protein